MTAIPDERFLNRWDRTSVGAQVYEQVSQMVNGGPGKEEFVIAFLKDHNTLQQQIGSLFLRCLLALAEQDDRFGDLRNEAIRTKARKIQENVDWPVPLI
jgi:hypothetical protein